MVTCGNNQSDATAVHAAMKPEFNGTIVLVDTQSPPNEDGMTDSLVVTQ